MGMPHNNTPGELMTMVWSGVPKSGTNMCGGLYSPWFSYQVAPSSILSNSLVTSCDLSSWNVDAGGICGNRLKKQGVTRAKQTRIFRGHEGRTSGFYLLGQHLGHLAKENMALR